MSRILAPHAEEVIRLYRDERWGLRDIGVRFGCSLEAARCFLKERGVPMNPKSANLKKRRKRGRGPLVSRLAGHEAEIVRLYREDGLPMGEIAERFGMHRTSTSRLAGILRAAGIEPQARNQYGRHARNPKSKAIARPKPDPAKYQRERRPCLKCGGKFSSAWIGERVCRACKGSDEWRAGV